jgi:hypothetical protein
MRPYPEFELSTVLVTIFKRIPDAFSGSFSRLTANSLMMDDKLAGLAGGSVPGIGPGN